MEMKLLWNALTKREWFQCVVIAISVIVAVILPAEIVHRILGVTRPVSVVYTVAALITLGVLSLLWVRGSREIRLVRFLMMEEREKKKGKDGRRCSQCAYHWEDHTCGNPCSAVAVFVYPKGATLYRRCKDCLDARQPGAPCGEDGKLFRKEERS